ncbi:MAG: DUF309 domain-containing protein [Alphaproteobacteria bacterium]
MNRQGPALVLPPAPHLPGRTPRPPEGFFEPLKIGLSATQSPAELASSTAFRSGLEAFHAGYYWEAHELWEAVWMYLPPASAERQLLRGLIQLANAGLKRRMGRPAAALRILALADAALAEATGRNLPPIMNLTAEMLASLRAHAAAELAEKNAI